MESSLPASDELVAAAVEPSPPALDLAFAAQQDELSLLQADTPLKRLLAKQAEAAQLEAQGGDSWRVVKLHQDMLALAKVHALMHSSAPSIRGNSPQGRGGGGGGVGGNELHRPLLLPMAHFELAKV